ncbi:hypothetical protein RvY_17527 [Ramazzottius varieornatus]|uniref:BZIP domain-containing protein n=1 Tax=Ramazzottius varieornatus TaxID=947166 RepID=A0A1D1W2E7_RAMVA|nr:hypothetical protein RvY_17527 [Ramazzottius varieornatus]
MSHNKAKACLLPLVTLKSLLDNPSLPTANYRRLLANCNGSLVLSSMNGKKDLGDNLSAGGGSLGGVPNGASVSNGSHWSVNEHFESAAAQAFLGPSIWDKGTAYDALNGPVGGAGHDFKLEYMDLDEFLSENGLGAAASNAPQGSNGPHNAVASPNSSHGRNQLTGEDNKVTSSTGSKERGDSPNEELMRGGHLLLKDPLHVAAEMGGDFAMSTADMALATIAGSTVNFDPRRRRFSEEELKPQPMVKKSKKQFVPDDMKDEKYWARRRKNNLAAKRSRDARRIKENQIAIRAAYLEKENSKLREQLEKLSRDNMVLREKLATSAKVDSHKA